MSSLVEQILDYESVTGRHRSGSFVPDVFRAIADALPNRVESSMETGTGKSTVLLSNVSARHLVFTLDDRAEDRSSVNLVVNCPSFRADTTEFIFGPSQRTLPAYEFDQKLDIALIDGPHAYPFPELEYYFVYPHLKEGALLIIDDVHIPTIGHMFRVLREDPMFEVVRLVRSTAILRRTDAPLFDPFADGWWTQAYNVSRFRQPKKNKVRGATVSLLQSVGLYGPARSVYRKLKPVFK